MRGVALAALLLAPLVLAEQLTLDSVRLLYPYLTNPREWPDAKLLILRRVGCPQVLAIGSSITDRTLMRATTRGRRLRLAGDDLAPVTRLFSFGLHGQRGSLMYATWRHVYTSGCVPPFVFVEMTPSVLRRGRGAISQYAPLMTAPTLLLEPSGFMAEHRFRVRQLAEFATWDRLLVYRQRDRLARALVERAGLRPSSGDDRRFAADGRIKKRVTRDLTGGRYERERRHRTRLKQEGRLEYGVSLVHLAAIRNLVREARAAGSHVVVHTPPATAIYRDIIADFGSAEAWCEINRAWTRDPEIDWYSAYDGEGYERQDFSDWVHLNRQGAYRYVERLFDAVNAGEFRSTPVCVPDAASAPGPD